MEYVKFSRDFTVDGFTFLAGPHKYRYIGPSQVDPLYLQVVSDHSNVKNVPAGIVEMIPCAGEGDAWTYIFEETGVPRQICEMFLLRFMLGNDALLELAKEFKLGAVQIQHMILAFDTWTGAADS